MQAAVVGGGIAGLVAARDLLDAGRDVIVLEASPRPGGSVRSQLLAGVDVDVGADAFATSRPETRLLVEKVGLGHRVVAPRRSDAHLVLADRVVRLPHGLLGVPTDLGSAQVVAVIGEKAAARARVLDAAPVAAVDADVTLGRLVRTRMGADVLEHIVAPVVGGVHACHPDLVLADAVAPGLLDRLRTTGSLAAAAASLRGARGVPGAAVAGLAGGMTTLVAALQNGLVDRGGRFCPSTPVTAVDHDSQAWRVRAGDELLRVDELVLSVDAASAAALLRDAPAIVAALAEVRTNDVAVVAVVVDDDRLDADPLGSGALIAQPHPEVRAKAVTHATAKWAGLREAFPAGRHVLRLSYGLGGPVGLDPDRLVSTAVDDVHALLGVHPDRVVEVHVARWPSSLVQPTAGHRAAAQAVREAVAGMPSLAVVGAGLGGNGLAATIAQSRAGIQRLTRSPS